MNTGNKLLNWKWNLSLLEAQTNIWNVIWPILRRLKFNLFEIFRNFITLADGLFLSSILFEILISVPDFYEN